MKLPLRSAISFPPIMAHPRDGTDALGAPDRNARRWDYAAPGVVIGGDVLTYRLISILSPHVKHCRCCRLRCCLRHDAAGARYVPLPARAARGARLGAALR